MYYLNYVLLVGCLFILICAFYFVFRECCRSDERDAETIIIRQPPAQVPSYTESTAERVQSCNHRIVHEYSRQSATAPPADSQLLLTPRRYYDNKQLPNYYMHPYPTSSNVVGRSGSTATALATAQLVQRDHGNLNHPREGDRPPPYAPTP